MSSKSSFRLNIFNIYHTTGLIRNATPGYRGVPRARYSTSSSSSSSSSSSTSSRPTSASSGRPTASGTSPVAVRYIGQGTYWLSLLLRILFFHLTTQTLLFFFQCRVSVFLRGNALIPALSACVVRTCYAHLSFFLSSKPEVYTATNKSENASGAAMRMNKR